MAEVRIIVSGIDPSIVKIIFCFREKQVQPQKFQRNKAGKNKYCSIWSRDSTLLRFATKYRSNQKLTL